MRSSSILTKSRFLRPSSAFPRYLTSTPSLYTTPKDPTPSNDGTQDFDSTSVTFKPYTEVVITPRSQSYAQWYLDVINAADMMDHSPVRGCIVIKPLAMTIWDNIRKYLDTKFTELGVQNAYFPLLIPLSFFSKESEHVSGFAKECAVVTHHRLKEKINIQGTKEIEVDHASRLEEPYIIRPTSETIIWNMYSKWIHSHRDLPLKLNQWANVIRWELRTRPFLRTSEFLWQEGHTAHATAKEAEDLTKKILDVYADLCQDFLAVPVIKGIKSASERFAGADETYTIEGLMQNGWALQCGTSHYLGQNFSKAFDVTYDTSNGGTEYVHATSWGVSTRLIGAVIMTHSDDKGLVLPPSIAATQVVLIPILNTKSSSNKFVSDEEVLAFVTKVETLLKSRNIRVKIDDRQHVRPGMKYYEWERKGVPLRIEVGPRDASQHVITMVSRLAQDKEKSVVKVEDGFVDWVENSLKDIHNQLYTRACSQLTQNIHRVSSYDEMKKSLNEKGGLYLVPWKDDANNEAMIKSDCKATLRCYPLEYNQQPPGEGVDCFYSGKQATHMALFARAF